MDVWQSLKKNATWIMFSPHTQINLWGWKIKSIVHYCVRKRYCSNKYLVSTLLGLYLKPSIILPNFLNRFLTQLVTKSEFFITVDPEIESLSCVLPTLKINTKIHWNKK